MPDIPLDTLFIVGLLLASFVGKILEGKSKNQKGSSSSKLPSTPKDREDELGEKHLRDILRDTFSEAIEPISESKNSYEYQENETFDHSKHSIPSSQHKTTKTKDSARRISSKSCPGHDITPPLSIRQWLSDEGLGSKKSLRRAFLLKEVLDHPPGLRRTFF